MEYTLKLTAEEFNTVIAALQERKFKEVAPIMNTIHVQVKAQEDKGKDKTITS